MRKNIRVLRNVLLLFLLCIALAGCKKTGWKPGTPLAKDKIKVGVLHITDPFSESSGYAYAHEIGIQEMKQTLGFNDSQIIYKVHLDGLSTPDVENAIRELIANGANIIIATSWEYMDTCEKLAKEFPSVIFAHATGNKYNDTNFTNYFGRVYQAKYLSGIVAGMKTKTGKIGFVAPWGKENSEVTGNLNAFALGVEKVNPSAKIYVKITHSWFDPMGEATATRALIAAGCDIIAQDADSPTPQIEAEKAGVWGIGYNTDMSIDAPTAVLTSVLWHWGVYYITLIQSVMDGSFTAAPWFGSLKEGIVNISPLNEDVDWDAKTVSLLDEERQRIESGFFDVFSGVMETNDGRRIGTAGAILPDAEIHSGIDWYYRTVIEF